MNGRFLFAVLLGLSFAATGYAQGYPNKPIKLILPFPPGQVTDIVGRVYAERMSSHLGQPIVVQNMPGASGTIGWAAATKSPPDGYTITLLNSSHAISPALYPDLPYDPRKSFIPIALIGETPITLVVHPSLGVKNLRAFIDLAKQRPKGIFYGSAGTGSNTHLAGAYFSQLAGVDMVHVPYKAEALATDMVAGRIQATFVPPAFLLHHIRENRLQALAVATREPLRNPLELPTFNDSGLPGYFFATWYGFAAPANTPVGVIDALAKAIHQAGQEPKLLDQFRTLGILRRDLRAKEFEDYIRADMERLVPLMKDNAPR